MKLTLQSIDDNVRFVNSIVHDMMYLITQQNLVIRVMALMLSEL